MDLSGWQMGRVLPDSYRYSEWRQMDSFEPVVADSMHSGHWEVRLQFVGRVAVVVERPVDEGARRLAKEQRRMTRLMPKMKEAVQRH